MKNSSTYRILDANLNRLREALRVIEEYVRFANSDEALSVRCKMLRHSLETIEAQLDFSMLLASRDTIGDPFACGNRPEELVRSTAADVARASFKRGQEAARVIEEYIKLVGQTKLVDAAKALRFSLYSLEKEVLLNDREKRK